MTALNALGDIHRLLGSAMEGWTFVESPLCTLFIKTTGMHPPMGRKIFYSAVGFRARTKMLRAALSSVNLTQDGMREFWDVAIHKAEQFSQTRNLIAHGDVLYIDFAGSAYCGQHIILQGREFWKADPAPKDVITQKQLAVADENFRRLAGCMLSVLGCTVLPAQGRELVDLLPSTAHSGHVDPNHEAKFSILKSVAHER